MDEKDFLLKQIAEHRRKLNLKKIFDCCTIFMASAGLAAILLEGISLIVPFYYVHMLALGCVLAGFLAGLLCAFIKRSSLSHAAHSLDQFDLKERVLTAYENLEREGEFFILQRKDAARHLEEKKRQGSLKMPLFPEKRRLLALALSLATAFALVFVPSAAREQAKELHEIAQQAKEKKEELQELVDAMEQIDMDSLTDEQKAAIRDMLDSLGFSAEELAKADSAKALQAAAQKLEYKYQQTAESLANMEQLLKNPQAIGVSDASQIAQANANNGTPQSGGDAQTASAGGQNGDGSGSSGTESGNGSEGGNGQGDGSGNGQGDGSGAGGSGDGDGSGGRGTGSGGGTHDYVSVPNALGTDPSLTGNRTGNTDNDYFRAQNGLTWTGNHVSLESVISSYTQNAYSGIESGRYPSGMENIIKDYFKNLND